LMIVTEPPLQLYALYIASPTPRESIKLSTFFHEIFFVYSKAGRLTGVKFGRPNAEF
jgi:hypothetical protein